jgi:hypothetical protein
MGRHARIVKRNLKKIIILKEKLPGKIMDTVTNDSDDRAVIFGFGNIKGAGGLLINCWDKIGEKYGL